MIARNALMFAGHLRCLGAGLLRRDQPQGEVLPAGPDQVARLPEGQGAGLAGLGAGGDRPGPLPFDAVVALRVHLAVRIKTGGPR